MVDRRSTFLDSIRERERERVVFGFNSLAKGKERKRDFLEWETHTSRHNNKNSTTPIPTLYHFKTHCNKRKHKLKTPKKRESLPKSNQILLSMFLAFLSKQQPLIYQNKKSFFFFFFIWKIKGRSRNNRLLIFHSSDRCCFCLYRRSICECFFLFFFCGFSFFDDSNICVCFVCWWSALILLWNKRVSSFFDDRAADCLLNG